MDWIRDHLQTVRAGDLLISEFLGLDRMELEKFMPLGDAEIDLRIDELIDERNRREGLHHG